MPLYLLIVLILILGILLGFYFPPITLFLNSFKRKAKTTFKTHDELGKGGNYGNSQANFNASEIKLLNKMYQSNRLSISEKILDEELNLSHLPFQQKKHSRGLLLKELNMKILICYGLRNGVIRMNHQSDKRLKMFGLSDELFKVLNKSHLKSHESFKD